MASLRCASAAAWGPRACSSGRPPVRRDTRSHPERRGDMGTHEAGTALPGGGFLIDQATPSAVFTPEDLSEEHRMVRKAAADFIAREVIPRLAEIEHQNWEI